MKKITIKDCDFFAAAGRFYDVIKQDINVENGVIILSYDAFNEIDLNKEINGESAALAALCAYSANLSSTLFCGVKTSIMGLKHISIAVCHKGSLVDIVDRTQNPGDDLYIAGSKIKIFSTGKIKIAALVDSDITDKHLWQKIAPHCDVIISILDISTESDILKAMQLSSDFSKPFICVHGDGIFWKD